MYNFLTSARGTEINALLDGTIVIASEDPFEDINNSNQWTQYDLI